MTLSRGQEITRAAGLGAFPTNAEVARVQDAIGRASARWAEQHGDDFEGASGLLLESLYDEILEEVARRQGGCRPTARRGRTRRGG